MAKLFFSEKKKSLNTNVQFHPSWLAALSFVKVAVKSCSGVPYVPEWR